MKSYWVTGLFVFLILSCARMGMPEGGPKDTTPPRVLKTQPPEKSVGVKPKKITLYFDELVVLKNPFTQILITPPPAKKPEIKPVGYPAKEISIVFKEPLKENTTYAVYFNDAIQDYRENNPLKNYTFVFSTGPVLDSLGLQGLVRPAVSFELPEKVVVGLYPAADFRDSLPLVQTPSYLAIPDQSGKFVFKYLREGKYVALAMEDKNNDFKWQPGEEAVGFLPEPVSVPGDSLISLVLFPPEKSFRWKDIVEKTAHSFEMRYEGKADSVKVDVPGKAFMVVDEPEKKMIWVKKTGKGEKISFNIQTVRDTIHETLKVQAEVKDTLLFKINRKRITPVDTLQLIASIPIVEYDREAIYFVPETVRPKIFLKNGRLLFTSFAEVNSDTLKLKILPGALQSFLGEKNVDTLDYSLIMIPREKTGTYTLEIQNPPDVPVLVQLLDEKGQKVIREVYVESAKNLRFDYLLPGKYRLRMMMDKNRNGRWDNGDYFAGLQAEPVYLHPQMIEIRPNWELSEKIDLAD